MPDRDPAGRGAILAMIAAIDRAAATGWGRTARLAVLIAAAGAAAALILMAARP